MDFIKLVEMLTNRNSPKIFLLLVLLLPVLLSFRVVKQVTKLKEVNPLVIGKAINAITILGITTLVLMSTLLSLIFINRLL